MERFKIGEPFKNVFRALVHPQRIPVFVVSLDALGTLYRFREPVSTQYLKVAQRCGVQAKVDPAQLDRSFRASFKHYNTVYPNYGQGKLQDPEAWWSKLVHRAFREVIPADDIPQDLGTELYHHFSSGAAYELYPDAPLFLQSIRALKDEFSDPDGPLVVAGVVTNSDPRVKLVLQDLGLKVGLSEYPKLSFGEQHTKLWESIKADKFDVTDDAISQFYDPRNDLDFLCTSYTAGAEKPDPAIWEAARPLVDAMPMSRAAHAFDSPSGMTAQTYQQSLAASLGHRVGEIMWMHIGDEYSKDYVGARDVSLKALYLKRDQDARLRHGDVVDGHDAETVSSLEEAAMVVSVMAQGFFENRDKSS
jgi:putative hydrolase of the HAD superfamily